MTVRVDSAIWHWKGRRWCHLLADDEAELHRFAHRLGVNRLSYQGPPKTSAPHYDITAFERDRALRLGAVASDRETIVALLRRVRRPRPDAPGPALAEPGTAHRAAPASTTPVAAE